MKTLMFALLLSSPGLALADKQPTVIVMPQPAQAEHRVSAQQPSTSLAVIQQQISDLSAAESRRDSANQLLQQTLSSDIAMMREKQEADELRIDKIEAQMFTIFSVGALIFAAASIVAGWYFSIQSERHKENKESGHAINLQLQTMATDIAVVKSQLQSLGHDHN